MTTKELTAVEGVTQLVIDQLIKQGLPFKTTLNVDVPELPEDITSVDDQQLMSLATKYMANYNFMLTQVAVAEIALIEVENEYAIVEAKALLTKTTGKSTEKSTMLKALVLTDPDIQTLSTKKLRTYAYHKMLKTVLENLERSYQLVSRELTRRTSVLKARGY